VVSIVVVLARSLELTRPHQRHRSLNPSHHSLRLKVTRPSAPLVAQILDQDRRACWIVAGAPGREYELDAG
jgi:hypothetical protein